MNTGAAQTTPAADIGGTHMRAALISQDGAILLRRVPPAPHNPPRSPAR
jgi:predicted NBD/HSP70 family sugar kinase